MKRFPVLSLVPVRVTVNLFLLTVDRQLIRLAIPLLIIWWQGALRKLQEPAWVQMVSEPTRLTPGFLGALTA